MASKVKKTTAKPTKATAKKTAIKKKPVAKAVIAKKKVTKVAKKATPAKKPIQKKGKELKKAVVAKKPVAKKTKPVKKAPEVKKAAVKKSAVKKPVAVKKAATVVKKPVAPVKAIPIKIEPKKPHLKIVQNKKETVQPVLKTVTNVTKISDKQKTVTKPEESTVKGVKKRIMQPLEVRVIKPSTAGLFGVSPYIEKDGEEFMNEAQKTHFREILWRWKRELMEEVDRTKSHMQDGASRHPDPSDNATQEEEFNLELRTRDRERKLIKKIDEALIRIDNDEYGYCDACGIEIGIRRLEARPTAEMCIDCKTLDEIKERQTRA